MQKLLIMITKSNWGGAQRYVYDLVKNLPRDKYEIVVALGGAGELSNRLREMEIRVTEIPHLGRDISILDDLFAISSIYNIISLEKPDIIHLNSSKIGAMGAMIGRMLKVKKIMFTLHGLALNEDREIISKLLMKLIYGLTISLCHQTIAVSKNLHIEAQALFPFIKNKIVCVQNGIPPLEYNSKEEARQFLDSLCKDQDLSPERFVIGSIGELHHVKGHIYLLHAMKQLLLTLPIEKAQLPKLVIIGEGEERKKLEETVRDLDLASRVSLPGHVKDAYVYMKAFDVFVIPSLSEALGYVALEAGGAGLPVLASNVGGLREIIENDVTGLTFPPRDPKAIADCLTTLITNHELCDKLGKNLQEKVAQDFNLEKMVRETEKVYSSDI